jgi:hypothetical protein
VFSLLPCGNSHRADQAATLGLPFSLAWVLMGPNTCALSHHFQVNALRLVLKLLQLRQCGLHTLCDLSPPGKGRKHRWTWVSSTAPW